MSIANADLPSLFLSRPDELKRYFEYACAQANNQFRDAVSFVIVPNVAEFKKKRPAKRKGPSIDIMDDPALEAIRAAQAAASTDDESYGKVTYVDEMLPLMDWGYEYGFQVLFSTEERVRAGRTKREYLQSLNDAYAIDSVVERESGDCGIICLPDFTIMPPDGKLITGKTAETGIEIGVDVPELTVRSCFVAAGRLMANDVPDYLRRKLQHARKDVTSMRADLPGIGIDLAINPYLGETDLPTDHFLNDGLMGRSAFSRNAVFGLHPCFGPVAVFVGSTHPAPAAPRRWRAVVSASALVPPGNVLEAPAALGVGAWLRWGNAGRQRKSRGNADGPSFLYPEMDQVV